MKKTIALVLTFSVFGLLINVIRYFPDQKLHITFCNVGQGDAIYIRFPDSSDMLIDGGPHNGKVLACLGNTMPFYDRQIDVVLLTHPQADHLGGLVDVIKRYRLRYFVTPPVGNTTKGYSQLIALLGDKEIPIKNLYSGAQLRFGKAVVNILWPERDWTAQKMSNVKCQMSNGICLAGAGEYSVVDMTLTSAGGAVLGASASENLNHFSIIAHLSYGMFDALFTGDADATTQKAMFAEGIVVEAYPDDPIEVFKVPHHGSRTGILEAFLEAAYPQLAVISVGKQNRYGHPAAEVLELLSQHGLRLLRTDQDGAVEVVSDGRTWQVK